MVEMAKVSKYFKVYVSNVKQCLVGKEFLSISVSWALVWLQPEATFLAPNQKWQTVGSLCLG